MKLFFYTLRDFDELACAKAFSKEFGIDFDYTSAYPDAENYKLAAGADGVCMTPCALGGAMLERFASVGVRWILCRSIGYDHVDLDKAKALGLRVSNVSYPPSGVANYAIMLMLMLQRRIMSILRRADLQDYSLRGKIGDDISFSTVGVIGTGRIGRTVIEHLAGFGCRILCYDPYENAAVREHASYVSLEELYAQSDIISFHFYGDYTHAKQYIHILEQYGRPLINTEWMHRPYRSLIETHLPLWKKHKVGSYFFGFVNGKAQFNCVWEFIKKLPDIDTRLWMHDIFHSDFTPYDPDEIEVLRECNRDKDIWSKS